MTGIGLILFHIGFIVGAFVLTLMVGTVIFYFRIEEASHVGGEMRFIDQTSDYNYRSSPLNSAKDAVEVDWVARVGGSSSKDFDDAQIVFPLRQTNWASRQAVSLELSEGIYTLQIRGTDAPYTHSPSS